MRTTLTLDPDVAAMLQREMKRTGAGQKTTINRALRQALSGNHKSKLPKFEVKAHHFGATPGVDFDRMNQLYDELETEDAIAKMEWDHDSARP